MGVVKIPAVQTWVVARVTSWLSDELNTVVKADEVNITFFRGVRLKGLYIEDLKHDTLVYIPELDVRFSGFSYKTQRLVVEKAVLRNARIKLIRYADMPGLNIDFLADYFSGSSGDSTATPWDVKVKKVSISNAMFSYRDKRWNDVTQGMDYEDMVYDKLNLVMTKIEPSGDSVRFHIDRLSAREKCGFYVKELKGDMLLSSTDLALFNLDVTTDKSHVIGNAALKFESWNDFGDFINKVKMNASFEKSKLSTEDIKEILKAL